MLFLGSAGLFWRTVTLSTDAALLHRDVAALEAAIQDVKDIKGDMAAVKTQTAQLMYDHAVAEWVLQADYNRRHHLPLPPAPPTPK